MPLTLPPVRYADDPGHVADHNLIRTALEELEAGIGGGTKPVAASAFTAASVVNVNNCFTSDYRNYRIVVFGLASTAALLLMRLRAAGADSSASIYYFQDSYRDGGTNGGAARTESSFWLTYASTEMFVGEALVFGPALAADTGFHAVGGRQTVAHQAAGYHDAATAYDGFSITPNGGTITGVVRVYPLTDTL